MQSIKRVKYENKGWFLHVQDRKFMTSWTALLTDVLPKLRTENQYDPAFRN